MADDKGTKQLSPDDLKAAYAAGQAKYDQLTPDQKWQQSIAGLNQNGPWLTKMGQKRGGAVTERGKETLAKLQRRHGGRV